MKSHLIALSLILTPALACAASAPGDRVYTGDQTSNTVSVIDPSNNTLLGLIRLGENVPASLSPLYKGQLLTHGLGFSPDGGTLVAVSIGSNAVTFIDTATNAVRGTTYVGRSPHEAFFTPDGREVWVSVRGEDYVSVLDAATMRETHRITTANGPGMVMFRPDGKYAFVVSSFVPELNIVDVATHAVVAKVKQASPFSPNLDVSDDGKEVWFTLKDIGKTQVISASPPFATLATLDTGPITNHVNLVDTPSGRFAYVTVGGENALKVYRRDGDRKLVATIPLGDLPHGLWSSPDGARLYVGLENGDAVQVFDTATNARIATINVGQLPQALVYVPHAVRTGDGRKNLIALDTLDGAAHLRLQAAPGANPAAAATVVVNHLGLVDQVQIAATGLTPGAAYQLVLLRSGPGPVVRTALAKLKVAPSGNAIAQAIGPVRDLPSPRASKASANANAATQWRLEVVDGSGRAVLTQAEGQQ